MEKEPLHIIEVFEEIIENELREYAGLNLDDVVVLASSRNTYEIRENELSPILAKIELTNELNKTILTIKWHEEK